MFRHCRLEEGDINKDPRSLTLLWPWDPHNPGDDNTPANPESAFWADGFAFINTDNIGTA